MSSKGIFAWQQCTKKLGKTVTWLVMKGTCDSRISPIVAPWGPFQIQGPVVCHCYFGFNWI